MFSSPLYKNPSSISPPVTPVAQTPRSTAPKKEETAKDGVSCASKVESTSAAKKEGNLVSKKMWSLEDFDIGRKLGEGRFGKVYLAREKRTKCAVVLKCLSKEMIRYYGLYHQVRREIELQSYAGRYHKNVLRLFAYFWDEDRVFLVLDYADGGDLQAMLDKKPQHRFNETDARAILQPLLSALAFLHDRDIIHRDVKPDNILFQRQELKLADFSWSVRLDHSCPRRSRRYTLCGTLDYLPPEHISRRGCTTKSDVWSVGVLAYQMLCGCLPFEHVSPREVCVRIAGGSVQFPAMLSREARHFVESLLCVDETKRISCNEALRHPFMQNIDESGSFSMSSEMSATHAPLGSTFVQLPRPVHTNHSQQQQQQRQQEPQLRFQCPSRSKQQQHQSQCHPGSSLQRTVSFSHGSFVSVSSSHSTDRPVNVSSQSCSAVCAEWATLKSGCDEFGTTSSHGASQSRSRSDRSGATTNTTQQRTQLEPSNGSVVMVRMPRSDDGRGGEMVMETARRGKSFAHPYEEEEDTYCAMRLRFDESITSLSQSSIEDVPASSDAVEDCNESSESVKHGTEGYVDPLSISAISQVSNAPTNVLRDASIM